MAAGAIGTVVGHPLDTLCVSPLCPTPIARKNFLTPMYRRRRLVGGCVGLSRLVRRSKVRHQTNQPLARISMRALFRGVGLPAVTSGGVQALNFGVYDTLLRALLEADMPHRCRASDDDAALRAPLAAVALAAAGAGVTISALTCPLQHVKVRQQLHSAAPPSSPPPARRQRAACRPPVPRPGALATALQLVAERSLYRGCVQSPLRWCRTVELGPFAHRERCRCTAHASVRHCSRYSLSLALLASLALVDCRASAGHRFGVHVAMEAGRGVYMASFVAAKRALGEDPRTGELAPARRALAGAVGGMSGWAVAFPLDVVKARRAR